MKERPIIFSAPMVRAILEGRKTMTRRIAKGVVARHTGTGEALADIDSAGPRVLCPYGKPGDRLWVRERAAFFWGGWHYFADGPSEWGPDVSERTFSRRSIHMPRVASRITLEVTGVRVERLHDIGEMDALREGLVQLSASGRFAINKGDQYFGGASHDAREAFSWLWESINGAGSWDANPWVWVIEFKRVELAGAA